MRFKYVKYDKVSIERQEKAKVFCESLETLILTLPIGRAGMLALQKLEECYMWIGKSIRDEQVNRGVNTEHKPERGE